MVGAIQLTLLNVLIILGIVAVVLFIIGWRR